VRITDIRLIRLRRELDPPFHAAWDPIPRTSFDATVVVVETDEGVTGYGSGDTMDGFDAHRHHFIGTDPTAIAEQVRRIESVGFHAGRFWPLEIAFWDILGKVAGLPVATLLGGTLDRVPAYASTGSLMSPEERAESAVRIRELGFRAMKIRVDPRTAATGVAAVRAAREAVGSDLEIMVDLNQGWRMAGDPTPSADYPAIRRIVEELRDLDVFWVEEPLPYSDPVGMRRLRAETGVRIAAGEMFDDLDTTLRWVEDDTLDVYQMDVALSLGMSRARTVGELVLRRNRRFTPHTWSNGIGVLANLHVTAGIGGGPFLEFPFDPPGWTPERRDFMLAEPVTVDADGTIAVPRTPGIGAELDEDAIARWRI
jgi:D-galactarolactone cycloisomerase